MMIHPPNGSDDHSTDPHSQPDIQTFFFPTATLARAPARPLGAAGPTRYETCAAGLCSTSMDVPSTPEGRHPCQILEPTQLTLCCPSAAPVKLLHSLHTVSNTKF